MPTVYRALRGFETLCNWQRCPASPACQAQRLCAFSHSSLTIRELGSFCPFSPSPFLIVTGFLWTNLKEPNWYF